MGPIVATACCSAASLPLAISVQPLTVTPTFAFENLHVPSCERKWNPMDNWQMTYSCCVWIRRLRVQTGIALDILESCIHPSAATTPISRYAIDQILFGQGDQVPGGTLKLAFECPRGTECPTIATLTLWWKMENIVHLSAKELYLILDGCHVTLLSPVDTSRAAAGKVHRPLESTGWWWNVRITTRFGSTIAIAGTVLFRGLEVILVSVMLVILKRDQIGQMIDAQLERAFSASKGGIVLLDQLLRAEERFLMCALVGIIFVRFS